MFFLNFLRSAWQGGLPGEGDPLDTSAGERGECGERFYFSLQSENLAPTRKMVGADFLPQGGGRGEEYPIIPGKKNRISNRVTVTSFHFRNGKKRQASPSIQHPINSVQPSKKRGGCPRS